MTKSAKDERQRIVRYIRREARKLSIVMPIPDQIIRDTMLAVAKEIALGLHDRRSTQDQTREKGK